MRAVSASTLASNGGPDGGISSEETRGAIQPIISTGMAAPFSPCAARALHLHGRGPVNLVDRSCHCRLKLRIAHRTPEVFDQGSRQARAHAVIGGEASAGLGSRIAAGECPYPGHALVLDQ